MKPFYRTCLSLLLLATPLSVAWGDEPGKEPPQAVKTRGAATQSGDSISSRAFARDKETVTLASTSDSPASPKESTRRTRIHKEKDGLRKVILDKKIKRTKKAVTKSSRKTVKTKTKVLPAKKSAQTARKLQSVPKKLGIRTWAFPETAAGRTNKITELSNRISETENAYDAENAKLQKLVKQRKEQANPSGVDAQVSSSQQRLDEIMNRLNALHHHRNEVSDVVFLRSVKD